MFWLSRPPYLRWGLAVVILAAGLVMELLPEPTVRHPFATRGVAVGEMIDDSAVAWREVPEDLFVPVELPVMASRPLSAGDPVLAGSPTDPSLGGIPDEWWGVEVELPPGARAGMTVKLVSGTMAVDGVVVNVREGDFGERSGLVAVPGAAAETVAAAALDASIMVLVGG